MLMGSSSGRSIQKVAVFDFDGTSIDGQSGGALHQVPPVPRPHVPAAGLRLIWWGVRYKLHLPYRQDEARELVLGALSEMSAPPDRRAHGAFPRPRVLRPRYRSQALEELARCRESGMVCLLVSATFDAIAAQATRIMGFDGYAATCMERDSHGHYTAPWTARLWRAPRSTARS